MKHLCNFQPGPYFYIFFVSERLKGTTVFENDPVFLESTAASSCETGLQCNPLGQLSTVKVQPLKLLVFVDVKTKTVTL